MTRAGHPCVASPLRKKVEWGCWAITASSTSLATHYHGDTQEHAPAGGSDAGHLLLATIPDIHRHDATTTRITLAEDRQMDEGPQLRPYAPESRVQSERWPCTATGEPPEPLHRVVGNNYAPDNPQSNRINATLLSLVRNEELNGMLQSMRDLERTWNHKFNYPWTFLNDVPFTEEFKTKIRAATKAEVRFGILYP